MKLSTGSGLLVLAALLLLLAAPVSTAAGKGRKVTCKGAKVPVTVSKKTTCRPLAKAFPKPKAIDLRLAYLKQALKLDVSRLHARKARRARTLQSGFGTAGRRAQRKLLKLLPKALAFLDRKKAARAGISSLAPGPAIASAGCGVPPANGPSGHFGGATVGLLGDSGMTLQFSSGGLTFRLSFYSCGGVTNFRVPECPNADGSVDASGSEHFEVDTEVRDGERVLSRQSTSFDHSAKVHGEVGADAKLRFIKVEHTEEVLIVASRTGSYPIVLRGKAVRKIRVDMPGGNYNPAGATVNFSGDANEALTGRGFAATVDAAIGTYRSAEARWSDFGRTPYCAEPVFSPASDSLKLKPGDTGQLSIYAKARQDGGRATGAKWTLLNPENADFSPGSSNDAAPSISYTVTNAPSGDKVKVTAKVTSTAGVGEKAWTQPIELPDIEGSFGGEFSGETSLKVPSVQKWSGVVKFDHLQAGAGATGFYTVSSGNVSISLSGIESSSVTGCHQSGSAQGPVTGGFMEVTGTGPEGGPPYEYGISLQLPFMPIKATRVSPCPEQAVKEGYEGSPFDATPAWKLSVEGQESADGLSFIGSHKEEFGMGSFFEEFWTLHRKP